MIKERPILFSGQMVRALLDGRKTQTRRIVKTGCEIAGCELNSMLRQELDQGAGGFLCPYGQPGDMLWVRETWGSINADHPKCKGGKKPMQGDKIVYRSNPADDYQWGSGKPSQGSFVWRPSIFMPRWASRITLEIASVRVERLQDIETNDCYEEGITRPKGPIWGSEVTQRDNAVGAYREIWNSINGPDSWDKNPWVWVIEFSNHQP